MFDFGRFATEVAARQEPGGGMAFAMLEPGLVGLPLVAGERAGVRVLVLREGQHEYVFEER